MTPQEILGVGSTATQADIAQAWRAKLKIHHPDLVDHLRDDRLSLVANRRSALINLAFEYLSNPKRPWDQSCVWPADPVAPPPPSILWFPTAEAVALLRPGRVCLVGDAEHGLLFSDGDEIWPAESPSAEAWSLKRCRKRVNVHLGGRELLSWLVHPMTAPMTVLQRANWGTSASAAGVAGLTLTALHDRVKRAPRLIGAPIAVRRTHAGLRKEPWFWDLARLKNWLQAYDLWIAHGGWKAEIPVRDRPSQEGGIPP